MGQVIIFCRVSAVSSVTIHHSCTISLPAYSAIFQIFPTVDCALLVSHGLSLRTVLTPDFFGRFIKSEYFFILSSSLIFTARRIRNACTASYDTTRNVRPCFFSASSHLPYFFDSTLSYSSAAIDHHCFRLDSKCHRLSFQGSGIGLKLTTDFLMRRSVARCPNNRSGSRFL